MRKSAAFVERCMLLIRFKLHVRVVLCLEFYLWLHFHVFFFKLWKESDGFGLFWRRYSSVVPKLIHCSEYQLGITVLSSSVF